jgi:hypothetical protein
MLNLAFEIMSLLLRMVICLICFVLSKSPNPEHLSMEFVMLESPQWVGLHEGDFEMFRPMMQELLNIEKNCHWKLNKIKTKTNFEKVGILVLLKSSWLISRVLYRWFCTI